MRPEGPDSLFSLSCQKDRCRCSKGFWLSLRSVSKDQSRKTFDQLTRMVLCELNLVASSLLRLGDRLLEKSRSNTLSSVSQSDGPTSDDCTVGLALLVLLALCWYNDHDASTNDFASELRDEDVGAKDQLLLYRLGGLQVWASKHTDSDES